MFTLTVSVSGQGLDLGPSASVVCSSEEGHPDCASDLAR